MDEANEAWRRWALPRAIDTALVLGVGVACVALVVTLRSDPADLASPLFLAMNGVFVALVLLRIGRLPHPLRAGGFVLGMLLLGGLAVANYGLSAGPILCLFLASLAAGLFLRRAMIGVVLGASVVLVVAIGHAVAAGVLEPISSTFAPDDVGYWYRAAIQLGLIGGIIATMISLLLSEMQRREERRAEALRLEALGRFAGAVAHDVNNALQVVLAWSELLAKSEDPEARLAAEHLADNAGRTKGITRRLLGVTKADDWSPHPLALATEVRRWRDAMGRLVPADIELVLEAKDDPVVDFDPIYLDRVLLNLVANARDALDGKGRITLGVVALEGRAQLTVTDDGPGISEEVRGRIFEPFVSSKGEGGTGLGLAVVQTALDRARGRIRVESEPGQGTAFVLELPFSATPERATKTVRAPDALATPGTLLLVDDDDGVRRTLARALSRAGWTVVQARDGDEANDALTAGCDRFDALCTDAVMPGAPTRELIDRFRAGRPDGRVLLLSGHVPSELELRGLADVTRLEKPCALQDLLGALGGAPGREPPRD